MPLSEPATAASIPPRNLSNKTKRAVQPRAKDWNRLTPSTPYRQSKLPAFRRLKISSVVRQANKADMTLAQSPYCSPKRKRGEPTTPMRMAPGPLNTSFTTNIHNLPSTEDQFNAESPRTQVSAKFENMLLEGSEAGVTKLALASEYPQLENEKHTMEKTRKRAKFVACDTEVPETPQTLGVRFGGAESFLNFTNTSPAAPNNTSFTSRGVGNIANAYPSINRLSDTISRQKRAATPPLLGNFDTPAGRVLLHPLDPERAALTWHDYEITGFDPEDKDDDGRGLDGIGFKPTAARVDARVQKKRQQLAEYRSRESKEARAKRSERRRGNSSANTSFDKDNTERDTKVRFSNGEAEMITI